MAQLNFDSTQIFVYGIVWTAIWGSLGFFVGYYGNIRRDFRMQKADFLQFLGEWYQEIYRVSAGDRVKTWEAYTNRERDFVGHITKLQRGFWKRRTFLELCAPLCELHPANFETGQKDCREVITEPIQKLIAWL